VRRRPRLSAALLALATWLDENGVTRAVMESTGVYWKPVWQVLDDGEHLTGTLSDVMGKSGRAILALMSNDERAGKKRDRRIRKGSRWLRATLVQAAWAAAHSKGTYLRALFLRLRRKGAKKATIAVAASMLTAVWHMLRNGVEYEDLGADHFTRRDEKKAVARLTRRIEALGYNVEVKPKAA